MAVVEEKPKGYLVITVIEASGKNKNELYVWDAAEFEGYVKSTYANFMHLAYQI